MLAGSSWRSAAGAAFKGHQNVVVVVFFLFISVRVCFGSPLYVKPFQGTSRIMVDMMG